MLRTSQKIVIAAKAGQYGIVEKKFRIREDDFNLYEINTLFDNKLLIHLALLGHKKIIDILLSNFITIKPSSVTPGIRIYPHLKDQVKSSLIGTTKEIGELLKAVYNKYCACIDKEENKTSLLIIQCLLKLAPYAFTVEYYGGGDNNGKSMVVCSSKGGRRGEKVFELLMDHIEACRIQVNCSDKYLVAVLPIVAETDIDGENEFKDTRSLYLSGLKIVKFSGEALSSEALRGEVTAPFQTSKPISCL